MKIVRLTLVVDFGSQVLLERLVRLGEIVLHHVEESLVCLLRDPRVSHDQCAIFDQRFGRLYGRESASTLVVGVAQRGAMAHLARFFCDSRRVFRLSVDVEIDYRQHRGRIGELGVVSASSAGSGPTSRLVRLALHRVRVSPHLEKAIPRLNLRLPLRGQHIPPVFLPPVLFALAAYRTPWLLEGEGGVSMTEIHDVPALVAPSWVVAYANGPSSRRAAGVLPAELTPQPCIGPAQIGNTIQIFLLGVFTTMFARYASAGELRRHGTLGQVALWSSLVLNWIYTGLCVYESYYAAGESACPSQLRHSQNFDFCFSSQFPRNARFTTFSTDARSESRSLSLEVL